MVNIGLHQSLLCKIEPPITKHSWVSKHSDSSKHESLPNIIEPITVQ
jgi:hypothetical protein